MNIQLGRGGKVHYSTTPDGFMPGPACGGNRAVEGYREVTAEVDCKNCLKITLAEAAKAAAEAPAAEKGENMTTETTYATTHPTTGKAITLKSARPAKWAAWEGAELFGLSNAGDSEAEAIATLPEGRNLTVTPISPISPRKGGDSAIIATDVPVNAGTATTEKETEMPPRKRAAAKPANETADAIQRVKDLTAQVLAIAEAGEGADVERAKELADQAEAVISELPVKERTLLRAALEEAKRGESTTAEGTTKPSTKKAVAKKTAKVVESKESTDYKISIPDAEKVVEEVAKAYATGVEFEKSNANTARTIAEKVLEMRLYLADKDGHPDFHGKSNAAKQIATDIYAAAGKGFEHTEENEDALDRLVKSVQNLRNDVLVKYVRNIGKEDALKFFPLAMKADPEADPAAAIQTFYKIPAQSTFEIQAEKRRLERAQRKALGAGDEKKAKELGEAIKTVGSAEGEGEGESEGSAPTTPADKRKAKHLGAIGTAAEKLAGIEEDLKKIGKEEAADLVAKLEAFIGQSTTLVSMLKDIK